MATSAHPAHASPLRRAWTTLLTNPSYLVGVRALHRSLQESGTAFPLVVMVPPDLDPQVRAQLAADGCVLRDVAPVEPRAGAATNYAFARFADVWTKLRAWDLIEYDRVVLLDADMLVLRNMDELFELPLRAEHAVAASPACVCNPLRIAHYPKTWIPQNCRYTYEGDGATPLADETAIPRYFNSGLMVLTPSAETFAALLDRLEATEDLRALQFPDQDLLNDHFAGRWTMLPYVYNALKTLSRAHANLWRIEDVKNLHFILAKPWEMSEAECAEDPYADLSDLWRATHARVVTLPSATSVG